MDYTLPEPPISDVSSYPPAYDDTNTNTNVKSNVSEASSDDSDNMRELLSDEQKIIFDELYKLVKNKTYDEPTITILYKNMTEESKGIVFNATCTFNVCPEILKKYTWLEHVTFKNVYLKIISNIPSNVKYVSFATNLIHDVPQSVLPEGLVRLSIADNNLSSIDFKNLPQTLQQLDLSKNNISVVTNADHLKNLEILVFSENKLKEVPKFNDTLKRLDISKNDIKKLENLPEDLVELDCSECNLKDLNGVPKKLTKLIAFSNEFKFIITLGESLHICDLSHNKISYLTNKIPTNMRVFDISNNELTDFKQETPEKMVKLNISHNQINNHKLKDIVKKNVHIDDLVSDHKDDDDDISGFNLFDDNPAAKTQNYWNQFKNGNTLGTGHNHGKYNRHKYNYNYYNYYNHYNQAAVEIVKPKPHCVHNATNPYYIVHTGEVKMSDVLKRKKQ